MGSEAPVQCPFCGTEFELAVDPSMPYQQFVTDCENCCRPFEVRVECTKDDIVIQILSS